jgi:hypothetical protein
MTVSTKRLALTVVFLALLPTNEAFNVFSRKPVPSPVAIKTKQFTPFEDGFLRTCAAGWVALCPISIVNAKVTIHNVFGLATDTFQDNLREPAAGFLEITSSLFPLEGAMLLFLATAAASSKVNVSAQDRSRIGIALAGVSAGTMGTLALAASSAEFHVTNPALLSSFVLLTLLTGATGLLATNEVDDPIALYQADASELLTSNTFTPTSLFYRSSVLTGLLVGASFVFSPISPIALFETEGPVTHMLRQDLGIYIIFLLGPVQTALFRAARDDVLGDATTRNLNVVTGLCCMLLVTDGRSQVNAGTKGFSSLQPGSDFYNAVVSQLGDPAAVGRSDTNTTAAFSVGLLVAIFYLFNGFALEEKETTD